MQEGFLLVRKPRGITSHDVVDYLRKITKIRKIGHSGTLDPMADGLLLVAVGRSCTRKLDQFIKKDKKYIAEVTFGASSDTYDAEGSLAFFDKKFSLNIEEVFSVINKFKGDILQKPPIYSAKKIKGKKMYELARQNKSVDIKPSKVTVYDIEVSEYKNFPFNLEKVNSKPNLDVLPSVVFDLYVSSGTYIRSIANDMGEMLGCGGVLTRLTRTAIDRFSIEDAVDLYDLDENNVESYLTNLSVQDKITK